MPCSIFNKLPKDQKVETRENSAKAKEISKKGGSSTDPTTTPLPQDPIIKYRDTTVQPHKKLKKNNLLCQMEKMVESFENDDEAEKSIEEPVNEQEVDEVTHRRIPSAAFQHAQKVDILEVARIWLLL